MHIGGRYVSGYGFAHTAHRFTGNKKRALAQEDLKVWRILASAGA